MSTNLVNMTLGMRICDAAINLYKCTRNTFIFTLFSFQNLSIMLCLLKRQICHGPINVARLMKLLFPLSPARVPFCITFVYVRTNLRFSRYCLLLLLIPITETNRLLF